MKDIIKEMHIMSDLHHANIVQFLGTCFKHKLHLCMLLEVHCRSAVAPS